MTAAERLALLLAEYPHTEDDVTIDVDNIVLVERSTYDRSFFVSTHATLEAAADYRTGQECPHDWSFETCVALTTGNVYDEIASVRYEQTMTMFPAPPDPVAATVTHPHRETAVALADLLNSGVKIADALERLGLDRERDGIFSEDDSVFELEDWHNDVIDFGWREGELVILRRSNNLWHPQLTTRLTKGGPA